MGIYNGRDTSMKDKERPQDYGGQAVLEGVMMRSKEAMAIAVRRANGSLRIKHEPVTSIAKKHKWMGWPIIRGAVSMVMMMSLGMKVLSASADMAGLEEEEPSKFEKWLADKLGTGVDKIVMGLAVILAVALSMGLGASQDATFLSYATIGFCLAAGTALAMWIGECITENGIGNGVSLLIFAGIIANLAQYVSAAVYTLFAGAGLANIWKYLAVIALTMLLTVAVVYVDRAERRIPIQYAKRMVGRKMYGGQSTHIPLRINASGVLPLIFASAIMQFPSTILAFFPSSAASKWWTANVSYMSWGYQVIFALLIIGFSFFYSSITFNPGEISRNVQSNGGMIPGIRQGKPTADFIARISKRITLFGALFLAVLATIPTLIGATAGLSLPFAASSLLIAVSVALETTRQLESQMTMRHYKGFLK